MDTIVAISTAPGMGGIGIIRISGKDSFKIVNQIFVTKNKPEAQNILYGNIVDKKKNKIIDEVLVSFFKGPKSYTKEDVCEINSHGGIIVMNEILELCLENGAKLAEPGEFTKRAFLNGRIDLTQAEAIIDMINAKSKKEKEIAVNQLEGELSQKIKEIKDLTIEILVNIEASIDYPEYDIEELTENETVDKLEKITEKLQRLVDNFEKGKIVKNGIKVAIVGRPNVGKSSLLNKMLNEERAIVTDIEGTTRDVIEETVTVKGIPLVVVDTAGIRDTDNKIEKIGIEKTIKAVDECDLVIAVFDNSQEIKNEDIDILNMINNKKSIIVLNKADLEENMLTNDTYILNAKKTIVRLSARSGDGIEKLYNEIEKMFKINEISLDNGFIMTNMRHKDLIKKAVGNTKMAIEEIKKGTPVDMTAINIKNILENLNEITGENVSEDIIRGIFSKFCLGK